MAFVLDCSVALSWLLPDEINPAADGLLDSLVEEPAVVPEIWPLEMANVLLTACRRGRMKDEDLWQLLEHAASLPVTVEQTGSAHVFLAVSRLAHRHGLTSYDAQYLALAKNRSLPLATLDTKLRKACRKEGVDVLPG